MNKIFVVFSIYLWGVGRVTKFRGDVQHETLHDITFFISHFHLQNHTVIRNEWDEGMFMLWANLISSNIYDEQHGQFAKLAKNI